VAGLLALVADLLTAARVLGAVAREVTGLAAVVALGAVDAVAWSLVREVTHQLGVIMVLTGHVANTTARVAGLVLLETTTAATVAAGLVTTTAASTVAVTALRAVAGNVANLAALWIMLAS
jgi:hypothetical protein